MFLACGVGAFGYAVFHLFTHAFFKALLFLGSGSVIHALHGEQDMRKMGGLRRKIPWTYWTFVAGTAAIAGIPFLAGYYSKDGILASALHEGRTLLFLAGLLTAILTAFYMSRLLFMTFHGSFRGGPEAERHVHEAPATMRVPLVLLAAGSLAAGFVHVPEFVSLSFRELYEHHPHPGWFQLLGYLLPFLGIVPAAYMYLVFTDVPGRIGAALAPIRRVLEAKWGFDDAFNWFARRAVVDGSRGLLWRRFDAGVIDGLVNGAGWLTARLGRASRGIQTGLVRGYALVILGGAVALLSYLLWLR
jgi:NADH-quinone oxidoreductase subunit L